MQACRSCAFLLELSWAPQLIRLSITGYMSQDFNAHVKALLAPPYADDKETLGAYDVSSGVKRHSSLAVLWGNNPGMTRLHYRACSAPRVQ
jgi:hypothetical protein